MRERVLAALVALVPLIAVIEWTRWVLRHVDAIEREIRPLGGLAYATFVQLAHSWASGDGWVQTVHRGYAEDWRWGGHYTPILFLTAKLASFGDSPWDLARVQVVAVGLGGLAAWKLGRAEAGLLGGGVGLALYLGSAPTVLLALADYQDLTFVLPLLPLAVWAARHGTPLAFVLAAAALGCAREETVLLLPVVGLAGGLGRAFVGALVTAAFLGFYRSLGPPPYPNPLSGILGFQVGRMQSLAFESLVSFSPNLYGTMAGPGWPWLLFAPLVALPGVAVIVVHANDPTAVGSVASPAIHHLAPLTAAAVTAGIVGACRFVRLGRVPAVLAVVAVAGATWHSWTNWRVLLDEYAFRASGGPAHPAWELLETVDPEAAIFVPERLAPAAAQRRRVVTPDSLGDRIWPAEVRYALDDGRLDGTTVAEQGNWRILADPTLPTNTRPIGAATDAGGRQ